MGGLSIQTAGRGWGAWRNLLSMDLRERVLASVSGGVSGQQAAERFVAAFARLRNSFRRRIDNPLASVFFIIQSIV